MLNSPVAPSPTAATAPRQSTSGPDAVSAGNSRPNRCVIDEASRAAKAAAKAHEEKFCAAALHRGDFSSLLKKKGLPSPAEIHRDATQRRAYEPLWRRWLSDYQPTRWPITVQRPEGEEFHCLNNPDPSAVIAFWRESARR